MAVISIVNQKGGVAKTTSAVHIAEMLALKGLNTVLFDVDPQGSASAFVQRKSREWAIKAVPRQKKELREEIQALHNQYDVVVVDTRPSLHTDTKIVIEQSDLVIIPVKPGGYEIDAMGKLLETIDEIKEKKPNLKVKTLICFASKRYIMTRKIIKIFDKTEVKPFDNVIFNSELFNQIPVNGQLIYDVKKNSFAKLISYRYKKLCEEIIQILVD